jgi:5-methylcytosine-specific restriction endonuclease McrA
MSKDKIISQGGQVMNRQYWKERYGLWINKPKRKPKDDKERKIREKFSDLNPELYNKDVLKKLKAQLISEYGRKCMKCDSTERIVLDHIKSRAIGGTNDLDNLQLLCWECNKEKGVYKSDDYRTS